MDPDQIPLNAAHDQGLHCLLHYKQFSDTGSKRAFKILEELR